MKPHKSVDQIAQGVFNGLFAKNCGIAAGGFQPGNDCAKGDGRRASEVVAIFNQYKFDEKAFREFALRQFPEDALDEFESEVGFVDDFVLDLMFDKNSWSDDEIGEHAGKLRKIAGGIRQSLENAVPSGKAFERISKTSHVRIADRPMDEDDAHGDHVSELWVSGYDDDDASRSGLSGAKDMDALVDYFLGPDQKGRAAYFKDAYLTEYEGEQSDDEPWEASYGETLVHPTKILQSVPIEETDFLARLAKELRDGYGSDDIISFSEDQGRFVLYTRQGATGSLRREVM